MAKRVRKKPATNGQMIQEGQIIVEVQGGPHDGKTITMDAMLVKLTAERLEKKHQLEVDGDQYVATAKFAKEFAEELEGLGYDSSPSIALAAWGRANQWYVDLKKKTSG